VTLGLVSALSERSDAPTTNGAAGVVATSIRALTASRITDVVVRSGLVAAVLVAPLLVWTQVHRTVTSAGLSRTAAAELGAKRAGLDPTVFDRLREVVPPHATYWVGTSRLIRPSATRQAFPLWASGALLPRVAVTRPDSADWVVTWGYDPRRLPVEVTDVRVLDVRAPPRLPVYVGRVVR
jgi:hypothetical protein